MPIEDSPQTFSQEQGLVARLFSALASRDFRWVLTHNAFASLGIGMDFLTQGWLVLTITDSPFWVGAVSGLRGAGLVGFGAIGGVIADRADRRKVLSIAQALWALSLLSLGLLTVSDRIELWHVLIAAPIQGMVFGVVLPTTNALIYDTVGPHRLLNAMAARMATFNLIRIFGSILAGTLISTMGIGVCYLFIAGCLSISPIPLLFVRAKASSTQVREPVWRNLMEGLRYVASTRHLRSLLLLSLLMEMYGFSYFVMLPVIAREVLQVGALGLGVLSAVNSVGALTGTLTLASMGDFKAKGTMLAVTSGGTGLCLLLFALSPWFATSLLLAALVGGTIMAYDATMATLLQLLSTDTMRGRVLGLYGLTFGFTNVGGFVSGIVATIVSAPFAIGMGGVIIMSYVVGVLRPASLEPTQEPSGQRAEPMADIGPTPELEGPVS